MADKKDKDDVGWSIPRPEVKGGVAKIVQDRRMQQQTRVQQIIDETDKKTKRME